MRRNIDTALSSGLIGGRPRRPSHRDGRLGRSVVPILI